VEKIIEWNQQCIKIKNSKITWRNKKISSNIQLYDGRSRIEKAGYLAIIQEILRYIERI
jgi:hypothetical protein